MLIAFKLSNENILSYVNTEDKTIHSISLDAVRDKKIELDNISMRTGTLRCNGFRLEKLKKLNIQIIAKHNNELFTAVDSHGAIMQVGDSTLSALYRKGRALNYSVDDTGNIVTKSTYVGKASNKINIAGYEPSEYINVYKLYDKCGILSYDSAISAQRKQGFIYNYHAQSSLEAFIESHKMLFNILLKADNITVEKVPTKFEIDNEEIVNIADEVYRVGYDLLGLRFSILVHPKDKRIIKLLNYKGYKVVNRKLTVDNIVDIIQYDDVQSTEYVSYRVMRDMMEHTDSKYKTLVTDLKSVKSAHISLGRLLVGNNTYGLRQDILLNNKGIRLVYNKIA